MEVQSLEPTLLCPTAASSAHPCGAMQILVRSREYKSAMVTMAGIICPGSPARTSFWKESTTPTSGNMGRTAVCPAALRKDAFIKYVAVPLRETLEGLRVKRGSLCKHCHDAALHHAIDRYPLLYRLLLCSIIICSILFCSSIAYLIPQYPFIVAM